MGKEINLLPKKNQGILEQERTILIVRAIAIFSVVIVISSGLGVLLLGRNYSLDAVSAQQESVSSRLQIVKPKIINELSLVSRVNHIQSILKTRTLLTAKISKIQSLLPEEVTLNNLDINGKDMSLSVASSSLASLTKFLDSLTAILKDKTFFSTLTIDNVVVDATTGVYTVNVKGTLL